MAKYKHLDSLYDANSNAEIAVNGEFDRVTDRQMRYMTQDIQAAIAEADANGSAPDVAQLRDILTLHQQNAMFESADSAFGWARADGRDEFGRTAEGKSFTDYAQTDDGKKLLDDIEEQSDASVDQYLEAIVQNTKNGQFDWKGFRESAEPIARQNMMEFNNEAINAAWETDKNADPEAWKARQEIEKENASAKLKQDNALATGESGRIMSAGGKNAETLRDIDEDLQSQRDAVLQQAGILDADGKRVKDLSDEARLLERDANKQYLDAKDKRFEEAIKGMQDDKSTLDAAREARKEEVEQMHADAASANSVNMQAKAALDAKTGNAYADDLKVVQNKEGILGNDGELTDGLTVSTKGLSGGEKSYVELYNSLNVNRAANEIRAENNLDLKDIQGETLDGEPEKPLQVESSDIKSALGAVKELNEKNEQLAQTKAEIEANMKNGPTSAPTTSTPTATNTETSTEAPSAATPAGAALNNTALTNAVAPSLAENAKGEGVCKATAATPVTEKGAEEPAASGVASDVTSKALGLNQQLLGASGAQSPATTFKMPETATKDDDGLEQ